MAKQRTVLVTGGSRGIGASIAQHFAEQGDRIAVHYSSNSDLAQEVLASLPGSGHMIAQADLRDADAIKVMVDSVAKEFGHIDILINNAAAGTHTPPQDTTLEIWDKVIGTSLTGYFLNAREFSKLVIAAKKPGAIVNISSIAGSSAIGRGNFAYSVAKGGVNQMTRELAIEWAKSKIRVNAIQPCSVNTPGWRKWVETEGEKAKPLMELLVRGIPMGRVAEPEDIAHAVHFLASDAAAMVTGTILPVDGGNLAYNAGGTLGDY